MNSAMRSRSCWTRGDGVKSIRTSSDAGGRHATMARSRSPESVARKRKRPADRSAGRLSLHGREAADHSIESRNAPLGEQKNSPYRAPTDERMVLHHSAPVSFALSQQSGVAPMSPHFLLTAETHFAS